jgi:hypothetical protein
MQGILYEEESLIPFLVLSVILGGAAAWATGRAIARAWSPRWQVIVSALALGLVVRFLHFALFEATLLSPYYYAIDAVILLAAALVGWRYTRAGQMTTQYRWLYERTGPLTWRRRPDGAAAPS